MANFLTEIKPHEVSKDLRGYSVLLYGEPKTGKTTTSAKFPGALLLAFERGFKTLPGVKAHPVNSWKDFRQVMMLLKEDETKEMYQTIVIDTVDIAYEYCTDYICAQEGANEINDMPYGKGYQLVQREFDKCIRRILQMDYGLVLISHATTKTEKNEKGEEYGQMQPTVDKRGRLVCERTCDIIGLARPVPGPEGSTTTRLYLRGTPSYIAGSRFKYTPDYINFSYENLTNAIHDAIMKEAELTGNQYITETKSNVYAVTEEDITSEEFESMRDRFSELVKVIMEKDGTNRGTIAKIVEEYLGNGRKVSECTEVQAPQLGLILQELTKLL